MNSKNVVDMTEGNPTRHILAFALPMFIGSLFQQFYNVIDSLVVGNYVSSDALAAIGTCSSINFLFFSLSAGLANGIGVIVSQYFGAKNEVKLRRTVANSFFILAITAICTTILGLLLSRPILQLMQTPDNIIDMAVTYLRATCCGIFFIVFYNDVAATLRALGDSKTPLYFLIFSSIANVGLNLVFVLVLHMGVLGVGIATIIAQALSAAVSLVYAYYKIPYFRLKKEECKPDKDIIKQSFKLGVPMALQSSMIAISLMVLQGVVNSFGSIVMAANAISAKVDLIVSTLYSSLAMATTTYSGQNIGAGKVDRVREGFRKGLQIVWVYNLFMIPLVYIFSTQIVDIFVSDADAAVIEYGAKAIHITSIMYFALGTIYIPRGVMNGCGDAAFSMINGITEVICRVVYANVLTAIPFIGVWGIWWASGLTWLTVAVVVLLRYRSGIWEKTGIKQKKVATTDGEPIDCATTDCKPVNSPTATSEPVGSATTDCKQVESKPEEKIIY